LKGDLWIEDAGSNLAAEAMKMHDMGSNSNLVRLAHIYLWETTPVRQFP
jgi:hypothetical protein